MRQEEFSRAAPPAAATSAAGPPPIAAAAYGQPVAYTTKEKCQKRYDI
jgi:hypothetical protein